MSDLEFKASSVSNSKPTCSFPFCITHSFEGRKCCRNLASWLLVGTFDLECMSSNPDFISWSLRQVASTSLTESFICKGDLLRGFGIPVCVKNLRQCLAYKVAMVIVVIISLYPILKCLLRPCYTPDTVLGAKGNSSDWDKSLSSWNLCFSGKGKHRMRK